MKRNWLALGSVALAQKQRKASENPCGSSEKVEKRHKNPCQALMIAQLYVWIYVLQTSLWDFVDLSRTPWRWKLDQVWQTSCFSFSVLSSCCQTLIMAGCFRTRVIDEISVGCESSGSYCGREGPPVLASARGFHCPFYLFPLLLGFEDFLIVVCVQMLRDSSQGKVKIIHGDVLRLDNEKVLAMAEEFLAPAGLTLSPTGEMIKLHSH